MPSDIPVDKVIELKGKGLMDGQIIQFLEQQGYMPSQILEAINQSNLKKQVSGKAIEGVVSDDHFMGINSQGSSNQGFSNQNPNFNQGQNVSDDSQLGMEQTDNSQYATNDEAFNMPPGTVELLQEISEKIVEEKWNHLYQDLAPLMAWKNKVDSKIAEMDAKLNALNNSMTALNQAMFSKLKENDENMQELGTEIKAMNKVFKQFVPELKETISDLNKYASKVKK